jgi:hypothetical protein
LQCPNNFEKESTWNSRLSGSGKENRRGTYADAIVIACPLVSNQCGSNSGIAFGIATTVWHRRHPHKRSAASRLTERIRAPKMKYIQ